MVRRLFMLPGSFDPAVPDLLIDIVVRSAARRIRKSHSCRLPLFSALDPQRWTVCFA